MKDGFDVAVAGAGILGLAHAYRSGPTRPGASSFARAGRRLSGSFGPQLRHDLADRTATGRPASISACRSRELWLEVQRDAGLWHDLRAARCISPITTTRRRFSTNSFAANGADRGCWLLDGDDIANRWPGVRHDGLRIGMFSPGETNVDPRVVVARLAAFLANRYGVEFRWGCPVLGCESGRLVTHSGRHPGEPANLRLHRRRLPDAVSRRLRTSWPDRCKLQMMRSEPIAAGLVGPMLAAGLTLLHYPAFAACPSLAAVRERYERTAAETLRFGIHVMASRTGAGELTLGDSHEYGDAIDVFDKPRIDELILERLRVFLDVPGLAIASRWHGTYVKHPTQPFFLHDPLPHVTAVTGVGGSGMTLSFGLAEMVVAARLDESCTISDRVEGSALLTSPSAVADDLIEQLTRSSRIRFAILIAAPGRRVLAMKFSAQRSSLRRFWAAGMLEGIGPIPSLAYIALSSRISRISRTPIQARFGSSSATPNN